MAEKNKEALLNEELSEETAAIIQESIDTWKEEQMARLLEEVEEAKAAKIEELEEANLAYREELREEYSDKFMSALAEMKESVRADVVASVLRENPELKVLEQIKEIVAPLLNEEYVDNTYSNTIARLAEENDALRRQEELNEGSEVLAELLSTCRSAKTQKFILSLIKEGNAEEVTEQFYNIMDSLESVFAEEDDSDEDDSDEDDDEEENKKKKSDDEDDSEEDDEEDSDEDDDDEEDVKEESYIYEDFEDDEVEEENSLVREMKKFLK